MNKTIKLITFDITGTLLKFRLEPPVIYMSVAAKYGVTVDKDRLTSAFKSQWKELNQRQPNFGTCYQAWWTEFVVGTFNKAECTGVTSPGILTEVADELLALFATGDCWEVMDGTHQLLSKLKSRRQIPGGDRSNPYILGIISNFDSRLHHILELTGIKNYFDFVILSHELQISKPDPRIFDKALACASDLDMSIKASNALHIGDNYELDCVGAVNAGWNSILFDPTGNKVQISDSVPLVHSLAALSSYVCSE